MKKTIEMLQKEVHEALKAAYTVQHSFGSDAIDTGKLSAFEWIECALLPYEDDDDRNNLVTFESVVADLAQTIDWFKKSNGSYYLHDYHVALLMIRWAHHNIPKEYWRNIEQLQYSYIPED